MTATIPSVEKLSKDAARMFGTLKHMFKDRGAIEITVSDAEISNRSKVPGNLFPSVQRELRAARLVDIKQGRRGATYTRLAQPIAIP